MPVIAAMLVFAAVLLPSSRLRMSGYRLATLAGRAGGDEQHPSGTVELARRLPIAAGALAAAAALVAGLGLFSVALVVAAAVAVSLARTASARRKAGEEAAAAIPEACRVIAAELMAGSLCVDALTAAASGSPAPLRDALLAAVSAEQLGASIASALARPPAGCEALRAVAACWEVCVSSGAALAEMLERLAVVFAAELEAQAVVEAELAGVRLSALVMAALPLVGLALGAALGADPLRFLIESAGGRLSLVVAALLDGGGLLWVRRLGLRAAR